VSTATMTVDSADHQLSSTNFSASNRRRTLHIMLGAPGRAELELSLGSIATPVQNCASVYLRRTALAQDESSGYAVPHIR
jgi:hypothetical protein